MRDALKGPKSEWNGRKCADEERESIFIFTELLRPRDGEDWVGSI